jgi:hypothetical protein
MLQRPYCWFADAQNGITDFFARRGHFEEELCRRDMRHARAIRGGVRRKPISSRRRPREYSIRGAEQLFRAGCNQRRGHRNLYHTVRDNHSTNRDIANEPEETSPEVGPEVAPPVSTVEALPQPANDNEISSPEPEAEPLPATGADHTHPTTRPLKKESDPAE